MSKAFILMYHAVDVPPKNAQLPNLYVTPRMFRFQMWYLKYAGFSVVSLDELLVAISEKRHVRDLVALTFDDGYKNFYTNAYPVIKKYHYPSTVFIVSRFVGKGRGPDSEKAKTGIPFMNWDEIREISENGVSIGSHTLSHPSLISLPPEELKREVGESKRELEKYVKTSIDLFCYPNGEHTGHVKEAVQREGYLGAVSTIKGHVEPGADPFALKRIPIKLITNPVSFLYKIHTDSEDRKGLRR